MRQVSLEDHPNKTGWYVKHRQEDQLYQIVSEKGSFLPGKFVTRRSAEVYLANYLDKIEAKARKQQEKKRVNS